MTEPQLEVGALLDCLTEQAERLLNHYGATEPILVGIHTGGVWVARELQRRLQTPSPVGTLEVAFHRDDHATSGLKAAVQTSEVPASVDNRVVLLIDDVIHTGRTSRAALNALFDYGRPARVLLATLVDRSGRELPIQPDIAATTLELPAGHRLRLLGPEPLRLIREQEAA
ncbi:bifunctional pyr operon transcriptional regulator/uracil phosphoribosyltransferase PyrR [Halorhodospira halochloris]|uniref:Uracil phosphoribosyltransferase n=1 Tax=Halorhodospira halochloris TaxID=1052 RepID=A0A0X8X6H1_HALHR|nr:bifunctional pyr operon transcriptional regulator/uracil phosphoribosyltransferase PyrR [Halorhodospira halochloris]MBK1651070.1 bifunctional pyr operon transcriptional regulator/uracil phosphoribosyltransferase [Halorhodospira halochloris]MCG5529429.1 bifunctional pyr operon transcriptional regulator/uracil phosphoribosyltransferase PyrR [Halorhodospira halochloris]BAU56416.1 uracil phosphoribosyltransferase [Halorhodospira halochloris]